MITDDRDFGELVFRHRQVHAGVIYFRLIPKSAARDTEGTTDDIPEKVEPGPLFLIARSKATGLVSAFK